jgi:hypothetical protein
MSYFHKNLNRIWNEKTAPAPGLKPVHIVTRPIAPVERQSPGNRIEK